MKWINGANTSKIQGFHVNKAKINKPKIVKPLPNPPLEERGGNFKAPPPVKGSVGGVEFFKKTTTNNFERGPKQDKALIKAGIGWALYFNQKTLGPPATTSTNSPGWCAADGGDYKRRY